MARKVITGDKELEATLKGMADKAADRVARAALGGALSTVTKEIRSKAPVGKTKNLKTSIGSRFEKGSKRNAPVAKAGINVGKRTSARAKKLIEKLGQGMVAPHSHLVGLGTKQRIRKRIGGRFASQANDNLSQNLTIDQAKLTTGTMPSNPFVKQAYEAANSKMGAAMRKRASKALDREAAKAKK